MGQPPGKSLTPPAVTPESDWVEMVLPFNIGSGRSLYSGLEGISRLRLRVFKRLSDSHLIGRAWFGEGADGPPLHVHGGAVAYVLDEAMGAVAWMNNYPVVAASLKFDYLQMTPLLTDLVIEAKITQTTDKRVSTEAEIRLSSGEVCVRGFGEFAILTRKKIDALNADAHDKAGALKNPDLKWAKGREK
jgi:Thioesterase superfamily